MPPVATRSRLSESWRAPPPTRASRHAACRNRIPPVGILVSAAANLRKQTCRLSQQDPACRNPGERRRQPAQADMPPVATRSRLSESR
ncbi:hypothetical protein CHLNCDRAFT_22680 [Chlorella variabilis]|uniref:Uncharacterized protein n=1 Tax=Chlorella variabilis TaxID=554065 RepID=E1ZDT6_CHLVA|nr:hypothetical protein CHLNCDRAFT_22680 [Chlorella variabilis]EFN56081.1 hypothetical protein CHLNCDRAFT_22680 [Chlorella variabilis]|eukprot:XP_005848183.1 hypothetical protein CHLNCDRAFT_22680 [Chlorella variabilis]